MTAWTVGTTRLATRCAATAGGAPVRARAQRRLDGIPVGDSRAGVASVTAQRAGEVRAPRFVVDPFWPKPLPNRWLLGQVSGCGHALALRMPRSSSFNEGPHHG